MTAKELHTFVGREIKVARLRRGLTSEQLAKMIKGHKGHISAIELGKQGARLETYKRIADALDIDLKSLLP